MFSVEDVMWCVCLDVQHRIIIRVKLPYSKIAFSYNILFLKVDKMQSSICLDLSCIRHYKYSIILSAEEASVDGNVSTRAVNRHQSPQQ